MQLNRFIPFAIFFSFSCLETLAQDTIVFENKHYYLVFVEEEREQEVVYRKFEWPEGPVFILHRRFITEIRYQYPDSTHLRHKEPFSIYKKPLDVWITPPDGSGPVKGLLHHLNDTTLLMRKKVSLLEAKKGLDAEMVYVFPYQKINVIQVRSRNQITRYALLGAAGGFALGTITGLIVHKSDSPCDPSVIDGRPCDESLSRPRSEFEKSLLTGAIGAAAGFTGGGIVGSIKFRFPIGGRKDVFNQTIPSLERMARLQRE